MQIQRTALQPPTNAALGVIKRNSESTQRYSMEKASAGIGRLMAGKDFSSLEEANAYLKRAVGQKDAEIAGNQEPEQKKTHLGVLSTEANLTDLERAQNLMYEAWGEKGKRRIELARQALGISAACADANILLAQESAASLEEARMLFEKAVKTAEESLGKEAFEEGEFWSRLETRPYLRAKASLAATLWLMGEHALAIAHMQDVLRLNPTDNQGIRYQLLNWFLMENCDREAAKLIESYRGDYLAAWSFSQALLFFKSAGDTRQARYKLRLALGDNTHVVPLLLGREELPELMPAYVGIGDRDEAIEYVSIAKGAWLHTPGAIDWLRDATDEIASQRKHPYYRLWKDYMRAAELAMTEEKCNKAKRNLLYARKQAEKFGEDQFLLCQTLSNLAFVYSNLNASPDEEPLFRKAVELTEEIFGSESAYLASDLYHLGGFLSSINKTDEAECILDRARTIAEKTNNKHLIASILIQLSEVYQAQGNLLLYKQAREESKRIHDELDDEVPDHHCDHH